MNKTVFLLLRLAIGTSMFGHGLVRLPKVYAFSAAMAHGFEKSILPQALVVSFGYALPFAEFTIGVLLLIGLLTRVALIAGCVLMILLIFGTTTVENWDGISPQLVHTAFFALLLQHIDANHFAVDRLFKK